MSQEDIDKLTGYIDVLQAAIGNGTLKIEDGDLKQEFQSVGDLQSALTLAEQRLARLQNDPTRPPTQIRVTGSKGLY